MFDFILLTTVLPYPIDTASFLPWSWANLTGGLHYSSLGLRGYHYSSFGCFSPCIDSSRSIARGPPLLQFGSGKHHAEAQSTYLYPVVRNQSIVVMGEARYNVSRVHWRAHLRSYNKTEDLEVRRGNAPQHAQPSWLKTRCQLAAVDGLTYCPTLPEAYTITSNCGFKRLSFLCLTTRTPLKMRSLHCVLPRLLYHLSLFHAAALPQISTYFGFDLLRLPGRDAGGH